MINVLTGEKDLALPTLAIRAQTVTLTTGLNEGSTLAGMTAIVTDIVIARQNPNIPLLSQSTATGLVDIAARDDIHLIAPVHHPSMKMIAGDGEVAALLQFVKGARPRGHRRTTMGNG
jgi:hypothetical protein